MELAAAPERRTSDDPRFQSRERSTCLPMRADGIECGHHPGNGWEALDSLSNVLMEIGLAIRDYKELMPKQAILNQLLKSVFVPHQCGPLSVSGIPVWRRHGRRNYSAGPWPVSFIADWP